MPVLNAKFIPFQCEFCKRQIPSWAPFFQHNSTKKHITAVGNITDMTKIYKPVVPLGDMMRKYFYDRLEHRLKTGPLTRGSRQFYTIEVPDGGIEAECEVEYEAECEISRPSPKFIEVKPTRKQMRERVEDHYSKELTKMSERHRLAQEKLEAEHNAKIDEKIASSIREVLGHTKRFQEQGSKNTKVKQFLKKSPIKMNASDEEKKDPSPMTLTCNSCHCDFADFDTALVHRDTDEHLKACRISGSEEFLLKFPVEVITAAEGVELAPTVPPPLEREVTVEELEQLE